MKNVYEKLKEIKRPVMLFVDYESEPECYEFDRIRILYPDGKCEWMACDAVEYMQKCYYEKFNESCFVFYKMDLERTLYEMKAYDTATDLKITKVITL